MKKLLLVLAIAAVLSGCGSNSTVEQNHGASPPAPSESAQQQEPQGSQQTQEPQSTETASEEPVAEQPAVLDTSKLYSTFGFADKLGSRLITIEPGEEAKLLDKDALEKLDMAIGENGSVVTIKYAGEQKRNDKLDNGRQMAHNFANLPGYLFDVVAGEAEADASYYLVNSAEFNTQALLGLKMTHLGYDAVEVEQGVPIRELASQAKSGRALTHLWELYELTDPSKPDAAPQIIYLAQYAREGDDMLFSLLVQNGEQLTAMDYPATYDEYSTWRVDDGGEVGPAQFSFLFAARAEEGLLLGLRWFGAEGESISFLKQEGDHFIRMEKIGTGRYTSPM